MMASSINPKIKAVMYEEFQLGKSAYKTWQSMNFTPHKSGAAEYVSLSTVKRYYKKWVANGRPGELVNVTSHKADDGTLVIVKRPKEQMSYEGAQN